MTVHNNKENFFYFSLPWNREVQGSLWYSDTGPHSRMGSQVQGGRRCTYQWNRIYYNIYQWSLKKIKHVYHVQGTFSLLVIMEQRRAWVEGSRGCAKQPGATVCGVELKTRRVERMTCSALHLLYFSNKCPMWFSTIHRSMTSKNFCAQINATYKQENEVFPWRLHAGAIMLV